MTKELYQIARYCRIKDTNDDDEYRGEVYGPRIVFYDHNKTPIFSEEWRHENGILIDDLAHVEYIDDSRKRPMVVKELEAANREYARKMAEENPEVYGGVAPIPYKETACRAAIVKLQEILATEEGKPPLFHVDCDPVKNHEQADGVLLELIVKLAGEDGRRVAVVWNKIHKWYA